MGKRDLPDIYALARGLQARGFGHIYIRQIPIAHVISDIYHIRQIKKKFKPTIKIIFTF